MIRGWELLFFDGAPNFWVETDFKFRIAPNHARENFCEIDFINKCVEHCIHLRAANDKKLTMTARN